MIEVDVGVIQRKLILNRHGERRQISAQEFFERGVDLVAPGVERRVVQRTEQRALRSFQLLEFGGGERERHRLLGSRFNPFSQRRTVETNSSCSSMNGKWPLSSNTTIRALGMADASRCEPCSTGVIQS